MNVPGRSTLDALRGHTTRLSRAALDFIYPPSCLECGTDQLDGESLLCPSCCIRIAPPTDNPCGRCGAPAGPHLDVADGCVHCRGERFRFARAIALGAYDAELRSAILRAKENNGELLAVALARLLWSRHADVLRRAAPDVVVPVPHHWTQRFTRRHYASETIARVLARALKCDFAPPILRKVRRTPAQATLPATRRRTNLRDAFRCAGDRAVAGCSVLLVDDVLTTGATANEATRALIAGNARTTTVAVVARGLAVAVPRT